ncbi:RNA-binding domain-containing protein [Desulfopila aestuarii]|uniref:Putative DNA-binding domain-containing protein n=1 Tax=Desulfopila aestuarii DSM 18488 TaxID=1121416 RepID=A0A1M7XVI5_9BACT|nr:RNA-binding domain-containing protein [Desulfopila aestuarii]SHO42580.1 Putative DNA-binding domain-containing protein [Desulfopila aestuarii DSM 18488]
MTNQNKQTGIAAIVRRGMPFIISFIILIGILLLVNGYQYWRMKDDLAATVIKAVSDAELKKLQTFIENVENKLTMVREWGKSGLLDIERIEELNKQLLPFLQHEQGFSGLVMANNKGREYFLTRHESGFLVRRVEQSEDVAIMNYQLWNSAGTPGAEWQQKGKYNPVRRPWFKLVDDLDSISWTSPYTFFESQEDGVTASIGWKNTGGQSGYTVFGIDILLSNIEQLLADAGIQVQADFFLVNSYGGTFLARHILDNGILSENVQAVLPEIERRWEEAGRPARSLTVVRYNGQKWLASLQPLLHEGRSLWVGVVVPEKKLLQGFNTRLYAIDLVDVVTVLLISPLLMIYLWKSGVWRHPDSGTLAPEVRLQNCLREGEGAGIEFKSSVRMNLRTGNHGKEIELAWLKSVVAFLNSNGGVLLIGVDDHGQIIGLEADGFENNDRCLLHIKNLIHQHIGAEFSLCIEITIVEGGADQVAMLECRPASNPVFLMVGKNEEFYIRSGPSSTKLSPSQMIQHVMGKEP